jgi:hypothetical protein
MFAWLHIPCLARITMFTTTFSFRRNASACLGTHFSKLIGYTQNLVLIHQKLMTRQLYLSLLPQHSQFLPTYSPVRLLPAAYELQVQILFSNRPARLLLRVKVDPTLEFSSAQPLRPQYHHPNSVQIPCGNSNMHFLVSCNFWIPHRHPILLLLPSLVRLRSNQPRR